MSATTLKISPKQELIDSLRQLGQLYVSDLKYIPEDKLDAVPMGSARTPISFTAECAGFNILVSRILKGETVGFPSKEEGQAQEAKITSYEDCRRAILDSVEVLADTIADMSDEDLGKIVVAPWGEEKTALRMAHVCAMHLMYHDGQINYIQALYGDAEVHW